MEIVQDVPDVEDGPDFSKLESTLVTTHVAPRPISKDGQHKQRHAQAEDAVVDELENDYDIDPFEYPLANIDSTHDLFSGILYHNHLRKDENFSRETQIDCLSVDHLAIEWLRLDQASLTEVLQDASERCVNVPAITTQPQPTKDVATRRALLFFVPLAPASDKASFKAKVPMTRLNVIQLFSLLQVNPAFLQNLLGRPDYWAPQSRWDEEDGVFLGCDFWCQHPRWNLQVQGAPLSVYCKYDVQRDLIVYIISHKTNDTTVQALRKLLAPLLKHTAQYHIKNLLLESPFDIQVMISNLNFEASKWHVERFRRYQWQAVNSVDDHLGGKDQRDRKKLAGLLRELQIVAQASDSHLANAQIFLFTARAIRQMAAKLKVSRKERIRQRTLDMLDYLIASMDKQYMWFLNYKGRKDGVMTLVFHFTQQTDAQNNIELAAAMKRDSTSMNAIAGLTMVFLPGTFTASVLSSGIFQSQPGMPSFEVTGLWWLWIATTIPITLITVLAWWLYRRYKEKSMHPVELLFQANSKSNVDDASEAGNASILSMLHSCLPLAHRRNRKSAP